MTSMNSFTKRMESQPNEISDILKRLIKLETSDNSLNTLENRLIKMESISTERETEMFSTFNQLLKGQHFNGD